MSYSGLFFGYKFRRPHLATQKPSALRRSDAFRRNVDADEIALRVATINPPIRENGSRPALATQHLCAGERLEFIGSRFGNDQFTFLTEHDQFAIGGHQRAQARGGFLPLYFACIEIDTTQISGVTTLPARAVEIATDEHTTVELIVHVLVLPG